MNMLVVGLGRVNVENKDGGSIRLYHILQFLLKKKFRIEILLPLRDLANFTKYRVRADFRIMRDFPIAKDNIPWVYVQRIIKGIYFSLFVKTHYDVVYAASDFWHDFLPALFYRLVHRQTTFIVCMFLLAPPPGKSYETMFSGEASGINMRRLVYYYTQQITIHICRFWAHAVLVLNEMDKKTLVASGLSASKVFVVSMGVSRKEFLTNRNTKRTFDGCFVGRLHPQKGITDLLSIWNKVVFQKPKVRLAVIGGGSRSDSADLDYNIRKLGLSRNVHYFGYKDGKEKVSILRNSKVMIVPSRYESWGQVIAEGLASGVPVVAYGLPIYKRIFSTVIRTVPLGDTFRFADAILELLGNQSARNAQATAGRRYVERFDWAVVGKREHDMIVQLVADSNDRYQ